MALLASAEAIAPLRPPPPDFHLRRALIDISAGVLAEVLPFLADADVAVVGSEVSPHPDVVRLMFGGDGLPVECGRACRLVRPIFGTMGYGRQRLVRVDRWEFVDDEG